MCVTYTMWEHTRMYRGQEQTNTKYNRETEREQRPYVRMNFSQVCQGAMEAPKRGLAQGL